MSSFLGTYSPESDPTGMLSATSERLSGRLPSQRPPGWGVTWTTSDPSQLGIAARVAGQYAARQQADYAAWQNGTGANTPLAQSYAAMMNQHPAASAGPGMTVGQYGAAGGGAPSDWASKFTGPGTISDKQAMGAAGMKQYMMGSAIASGIQGIGSAIQSGLEKKAQAAMNLKPLSLNIPGPEQFARDRYYQSQNEQMQPNQRV